MNLTPTASRLARLARRTTRLALFRDAQPSPLRLRRITEIRRQLSKGTYDPERHLDEILGELASDLELEFDLARAS